MSQHMKSVDGKTYTFKAEINEMEMKKTNTKISVKQSWFFTKLRKLTNLYPNLPKEGKGI